MSWSLFFFLLSFLSSRRDLWYLQCSSGRRCTLLLRVSDGFCIISLFYSLLWCSFIAANAALSCSSSSLDTYYLPLTDGSVHPSIRPIWSLSVSRCILFNYLHFLYLPHSLAFKRALPPPHSKFFILHFSLLSCFSSYLLPAAVF